MSLSSILDEIQGDAVKETPEGDEVVPMRPAETQEPSDGLAALEVLKSKVSELQNHQYILDAFKVALEATTLDKGTAMELFTMLPLTPNKVSPILTQAPTEHNKRQMFEIFNEYNDSSHVDTAVKDEDTAVKDEVIRLVRNSLHMWEDTHHSCEIFREELTNHSQRLDKVPPMVVYNGKSVNLFTADMREVMAMDSFKLDYKPYEGVLEGNYRTIFLDDNLQRFIETGDIVRENPEYVSLKDVANHIRVLTYTEREHHTTLHKMLGDSSLIDERELSVGLKSLDWYRKFSHVFIGPDALADKVIKLGVGFLT